MTAASFKTTVPEMQQASNHVTEVAAAIDGEMRRLDNLIQPISSVWQGAAAGSFLMLHQTWIERQSKLRLVLDDVAAGLMANAHGYQQNDDALQSTFTQTNGLLA